MSKFQSDNHLLPFPADNLEHLLGDLINILVKPEIMTKANTQYGLKINVSDKHNSRLPEIIVLPIASKALLSY